MSVRLHKPLFFFNSRRALLRHPTPVYHNRIVRQLYPYRIRVTDKGGIFFLTPTPVVRTDLVVTGRSSSTLRTPSFVHGGNFRLR